MDYLPTVEMQSPSNAEVNASVIWLHGLGADGNDFAPIVSQLRLTGDFGIRFVFPHAPSIPVTINNGYVMPAWYDIKQMDVNRHLDLEQLKQSASWVHDLIAREVERGVSTDRIIIAGFSQGGAVSYEAALSYPSKLAGIMALSTYFPTSDSVEVNPVQEAIKILICHGSMDPVVAETLGLQGRQDLIEKGFHPEYKSYPMQHAVCPQQIDDIAEWINKVLA